MWEVMEEVVDACLVVVVVVMVVMVVVVVVVVVFVSGRLEAVMAQKGLEADCLRSRDGRVKWADGTA
jgi:hypothetical protein